MEKDIELILINISGEDRPGLTSALTEILAKYEANILDIGHREALSYHMLDYLKTQGFSPDK